MWIRATLAAIVIALSSSVCLAETYGEKIKSVNLEKKTITFPVDGKDRTFKVDDKVDVQAQMRAGKRLRITQVKEGLKGVKAGSEATLTTEKKEGEEVVTKIVLLAGEQKK
jgi:hypothetical protein